MLERQGNFPSRQERVGYGDKKREKKKQIKRKPPGNAKKGRRNPSSGRGKPVQRKPYAAVVGLLLILSLILYFAFFQKNGVEVFLEGTSMGILQEKAITAEEIKTTLEAKLAEEVGTKVQIIEKIETVPIHIKRSQKEEICTLSYLLPNLRKYISYNIEASVIQVNGEKVAVLLKESEAQAVLETIKADYVPKDSKAEVSFVEQVAIVPTFVSPSEKISQETAIEKLQSGTQVQKTYTVQSGDSWYRIAQKTSMTVEKLLEVNPGMTISTPVRVGGTINILANKPLISVKAIETQTVTTVEPKPVQYTDDNTKAKGYQKVIQQGRTGQKESTVQTIRINGFVEEEKEIDKKIVVEPVTEIILRGTKE